MILDCSKIKNGKLKHQMTTKKGDSGAPLIVQPKGMMGECYIIGIHCSGKYGSDGYKFDQNNTAVYITKAGIDELAKL